MKDYCLADFDYVLPEELIAQEPAKPRDHCRLLLLNRFSGQIKHGYFYELGKFLKSGDLLIVNDSKVFPARLLGKKAIGGGEREVFLCRSLGKNRWECLVRGRSRVGMEIIFSSSFSAKLIKSRDDGTWELEFNKSGGDLMKAIFRFGKTPLPPYIKRKKEIKADKDRYQTIYADNHKIGSAAAPTAGLHFTPHLLSSLKKQGVEVVKVTLHVGLGTFAPVKTEDLSKHKMHAEFALVSPAVAKKIISAKKSGQRIVAVGTTSCRALESWARDFLQLNRAGNFSELSDRPIIKVFSKQTDIFIRPGDNFLAIDGLITNFHLPKSTLLMLVSALAGKKNIDKAYQEAIDKKYKFFSYGDAMFIAPEFFSC